MSPTCRTTRSGVRAARGETLADFRSLPILAIRRGTIRTVFACQSGAEMGDPTPYTIPRVDQFEAKGDEPKSHPVTYQRIIQIIRLLTPHRTHA